MGGDGPHRSSVPPNLAFGLFRTGGTTDLHGSGDAYGMEFGGPFGACYSTLVEVFYLHMLDFGPTTLAGERGSESRMPGTKVIPTKWNMIFLF
jgi:hypothetical protein